MGGAYGLGIACLLWAPGFDQVSDNYAVDYDDGRYDDYEDCEYALTNKGTTIMTTLTSATIVVTTAGNTAITTATTCRTTIILTNYI